MFPGTFLCRLPCIGALAVCGDACDANAPACAVAGCLCSPTHAAAADFASQGAGDAAGSAEARASALASLRRQLDAHNLNARAHYHRAPASARTLGGVGRDVASGGADGQGAGAGHGLGPDASPSCCLPSAGDAWGMSDVALRWTLQQAADADAAARAAARALSAPGAAPSLSTPLLMAGAGVTAVPIRRAAATASQHAVTTTGLPLASVWREEAASRSSAGGRSRRSLPLLANAAAPFHRGDLLHATHANSLAQAPWFAAVDKGRHGARVEWRHVE
jgi:hypothetical protein